MPFPLHDIRNNPRSTYARVPQAMAQFVLKIEKLCHIMRPTPILEMARLRSPSPIMAPDFALFLFFCGFPGFLGGVSSFLGVFRFFLGVFLVFLGCFWFSWGVLGFLGGVPGFRGVFLVFLGCSWFSWECSGIFGGVPGFSGVPECSVMFRCSGVPCSGVPGSTTCRRIGVDVAS